MHVVDNGRGIRQDEKDKLFCLFGRADRTKRDNIEGIGMGLTICKRIVDHYDGSIKCYSSDENQGSTFIFTTKMRQHESNDL